MRLLAPYVSPFVRPSVHRSVHMEQLGSHWTDFHETWYSSSFRKSVEKIQVSLKYDKNNGYFTGKPIYAFDDISLNSCVKREEPKTLNSS